MATYCGGEIVGQRTKRKSVDECPIQIKFQGKDWNFYIDYYLVPYSMMH